MNTTTTLIDHQIIRTFCEQLLTTAGLTAGDAGIVTDVLVEANLRGVDSHGVNRLAHYLARIRQGSLNPRPDIQVTPVAPSCAQIDGNHALGHLVMHRAAAVAIDLARTSGAGWVAVANSSHCGTLDYYARRIAQAGMIALVFEHTDSLVVPFGARQPFCGTNPMCLAVPGPADKVVCLDMATSAVAYGKIANAAREGKSIPTGWAVDATGNDTTDPNAFTGMHPMSGSKGSGLGLLIEIFSALLSGAPYGPDIPKMYGDLTQPRRLGGLVGAIDTNRFLPLEAFRQRVGELLDRWGALPPADGFSRVMYPGEPEELRRHDRLAKGIPIEDGLRRELIECARVWGVASPF